MLKPQCAMLSQCALRWLATPIAVLVSSLLVGCVSVELPKNATLKPFTENQPLSGYVATLERIEDAFDKVARKNAGCDEDDDNCLEEILITGSRVVNAFSTITNNQVDGVDEGDIVKRVGEYIVVLRRGRLFTFSLPNDGASLAAVDYIDVAPADNAEHAWYDEILKYNNTIIVLGYDYEIEGSLIRLFDVDEAGRLTAGRAFFFKSSDYFDHSNYATRLVDGKLVFYLPRDLPTDAGPSLVSGEITDGQWSEESASFLSEVVYQPIQQTWYPMLHTVVVCPLDQDAFVCQASALVGPSARLSYISLDAVYLWLNAPGQAYDYFALNRRHIRAIARRQDQDSPEHRFGQGDLAVLYRLPLNGDAPSVLQTKGEPVDQFSFRETEDALQVMVLTTDANAQERPAVLTAPLDQFSAQVAPLPASSYEYLPPLKGYMSVNRFVGDSLFYNDFDYDAEPQQDGVWLKPLDSSAPAQRFVTEHVVERIAAVGDTAVLIGSDNGGRAALGITTFGTGDGFGLGQTDWLPRAVQIDPRSHSFNYQRGGTPKLLGFPVTYVPADEEYGDGYLWSTEQFPVHTTFFALSENLSLQGFGELIGSSTQDDHCLVSCTDWYGDSRPFFIGERVFALMGYELVEAYVSGGSVFELARANALDLLPQTQ